MIELYIGGNLVDIDDDTNITLLYSSPFFIEIDALLENRSYTISLPLSKNNQRVIELSNRIDASTRYPYRIYDAMMIVDSVPIIQGGRAYLLTISDRIEIALTWGLSVGDLRDAMLSDYYTDEDYLTVREFSASLEPYFFPRLNYGNGIVAEFPAIKVTDIFDRIGIDYTTLQPYIQDWIMCATSKRGGGANFEQSKSTVLYDDIADDALSIGAGGALGLGYFQYPFSTGTNYALRSVYKGVVTAEISISISGTVPDISLPAYIETKGPYQTEGVMHELGNLTPGITTGSVTLSKNLTFEVNAEDLIEIRIPGIDRNKVTAVNSTAVFRISIDGDIENVGYINFPIKENLPEMKAVDFISSVCSMVGASLTQGKKGLEIIRLDDILKKDSYVDWSNKLVSTSDLSFTFLDLAKKNYIKYSDDSSVGRITVDNEILEEESDLVELPFLAVSSSDRASIVVYEYDKNNEEYDYTGAVDPVILKSYTDSDGYIAGTFKGLEAFAIIDDHYNTFKELVSYPRALVANIRLSIVDQLNLDFTKPIWMAQFGCFFALVDASISNGIAKCTLVRDTTISAYKTKDGILTESGFMLLTESGEYLKY